MDAERVAADHGDVIGLAGMHLAVEFGRRTVFLRQLVDVGRDLLIDDLIVAVVLGDDQDDVLVTRHALNLGTRRAGGEGACARCTKGKKVSRHLGTSGSARQMPL